jgi:hypothetical protein
MNARLLFWTKAITISWILGASAPAATITVTGTGDTIAVDGVVTLREAITSTNNNASVNTDVSNQNPGAYGADTINFNISGTGVHTISPTAALPVITGQVTINGYSQGGTHANTLPDGDNAVLGIVLSGANAGAGIAEIGIPGLSFGPGSDASIVSGLVINQFSGDGILIKGAGGIHIRGNFIGTNQAGTAPGPGNANTAFDFIAPMRAGVFINPPSNDNFIGEPSPAFRNILAGNVLDNVHISGVGNLAGGNLVQGNFIGVGADGASIISNSGFWGIEVSGLNASNNFIGGANLAERNVIGGNNDGIEIDDGAHDNFIEGNLIGVGADGITPAGNRTHGIALRDFDGTPGIIRNMIGSYTITGAGNTIANNGASGIAIFGDPNVTPQNNNNPILGNSIYHNSQNFRGAGLGIDLVTGNTYPEGDGPTPNDVGDSDAGPNNLQNYPVLSTFFPTSGGTDLNYSLNSRNNHGAGQKYLLEFFLNDSPTFTGYGEGQVLATRVTITVGANPGPYADEGQSTLFGTVHFAFVATGHYFSATATELADPDGTPLNTSEFSKAVAAFPTTPLAPAKLGNISTRGFVQTGDNVLIAGFIAIGNGPIRVAIIALGPSLPVAGALADPTMELHDSNGGLVDSNDNWMDSPNKQEFIDDGLAPPNPLESAIARTVNAPESYTAIVRGKNNGTGIAVVEVFGGNLDAR